MLKYTLSCLLIAAATLPAHADEVTLTHNGLTLNANLQTIDAQPLSGRVALITHGTLAHNGMEIITTLQELLSDEELPSLAINLNLGLDNRHGMYDCAVPHNHKHTDAVAEIGVWQQWLKQQGADEVVLIGHSRGGNQSAWFADQNPAAITAQILIAPATWSARETEQGYQQRYDTALSPLLEQARQLPADSWLDETGFIYCENARVTAGSFVSYYSPDPRQDTPTLLQKTRVPSLVIIGSEDETVAGLPAAMASVNNTGVQSLTIEGSDHFFRDLYTDEAVEAIVEFLDTL